MAGCVHLIWKIRQPKFRSREQKQMRFSLAVAVVLVGMSLSGWAQQNNTFKVKPAPTKAPKSAPIGKTAASPTASTSTSKELQSVERQSAKSLRKRSIGRTRDGKGPCAEAGKKQTQSANQFRRDGRRQERANDQSWFESLQRAAQAERSPVRTHRRDSRRLHRKTR